ncbi:hypothetical protein LINGRAHAP2_LOCUS21650 [Linum grandiflorum]
MDRGMRYEPMTGRVDFDALLQEILAGRVERESDIENYFKNRKSAMLRKCSAIMMAILAQNHHQICQEIRQLVRTVTVPIPAYLMYAPTVQLRAALRGSEGYIGWVIRNHLNQRMEQLVAQAQQRVDYLVKEEEEEIMRFEYALSKLEK